jgi:hypothetical protein
MSDTPSPNGSNGKGAAGRFVKGNPGGPGNPYARHVAELRSALFNAVAPDDLRAVVASLLIQAKQGDVASIKELLQRLLGPPEAVDLIERMDALEQKIEQLAEHKENSWR